MRPAIRPQAAASRAPSTNGNAYLPEVAADLVLKALSEVALVKEEVTLASGERAKYYVDVKRVALLPEPFLRIGVLVAGEAKRLNAQAVGGLTMGADPIACSAIAASTELQAFFVRKEPKKHGLQRWIEGPEIRPDQRALVVDDVVTTGGSLIDAIKCLQAEGIALAGALSVVDRLAGGHEAIEQALGDGLPYVSLFTIDEVYPDRPDRVR